MNKLALISTYCNNEDKLNALRNTIQEYKNLGVDIFVYSPIKLPTDVEEECKFLFYTDENPILELPIRGHYFWKTYKPKNVEFIKLSITKPDYGWASNYQLKKLINIASTYDYDIYYLTIYDLDFDDNIKSLIKNNIVNVVSPSARGWDYSLYFTPFDKQTMIQAEKFIDYSKYISDSNTCAEYVAKEWVEELGLTLQEKGVNDTINETENMFNLSTNKEYEFFINNNEENLKIIFFKTKDSLKLQINDEVIKKIKENYLYNIDTKIDKIDKLLIYDDNYINDYTNIVKQKTIPLKIEKNIL